MIYNTRSYNIELMCMWSITLNIFKLIKIFTDIINNKYYMVVGAKYDSSIMNDAHTNYPANIVSLPTKVVWLTMFFFKKEGNFCMAFVLATGWLTWESAHEV